jgi:hypothetical protein
MKRVITIVALATALLAGGAIAQSSPPSPAQETPKETPKEAPIPNRSIKLTAEQSYVIRENVLPNGDAATTGKGEDSKFEIGGKVPADAALKDFPELVAQKVPAVKSYKYLISDNQVVIVDTKDNTIADILK